MSTTVRFPTITSEGLASLRERNLEREATELMVLVRERFPSAGRPTPLYFAQRLSETLGGALSDPTGTLATPLDVIERPGTKRGFARVVELVGPAEQPIPAVGGHNGDATAIVQARLLQLGFWNGGADGKYGLTTKQAVMAFQGWVGLPRDGVAGSSTQRRRKTLSASRRIFDACTIALVNPASRSSCRNALLSTTRAAGLSPKLTLLRPTTVWQSGSSREIRRVPSMVSSGWLRSVFNVGTALSKPRV